MNNRAMSFLLIAALLFSFLLPRCAAPALPFQDVPEDAWYYGDVERAYGSGILTGVTETSFEPAGTLTLAQSVTLAARIAQLIDIGRVTLENGVSTWYSPYAEYAKARGIIGGEYDGRWNQTATRAEMVRIFAAIPGLNLTRINRIDDNAIPDVSLENADAKAVYSFYRAGILTGGDGNRFKGGDPVTRSEAAVILSRLLYPERRQNLTLLNGSVSGMNAGNVPGTDSGFAPGTYSGDVPGKDAELNEENLLALLDAYDPDGAWIVRSTEGMRYSWRDWIHGAETLGELEWNMETIVHEQLHCYASSANYLTPGKRQEYIYLGGGQSELVPITHVYDSVEMAELIPQELRTGRYNTYVGKEAAPNTSSRLEGVYGLLDEFAAYYWGLNNINMLLPYYASGSGSYDNTYVAFAEFRYYILGYMLYAREHHPLIYQGIMDNSAFLRAFSAIDAKFAEAVEVYREARPKVTGSSFETEYQALLEAMSAPEYQEMLELLTASSEP